MRKHYSSAFKSRMVQEVLKGGKAIGQIASAHGVHPNPIGLWKATALEHFPNLVEKEAAPP
jgi:transposase-like protein